jgi:hypothetical protein
MKVQSHTFRIHIPLSGVVLAILLGGCTANQEESSGGAAAPAPRVDHARAAWLAYEHEIKLESPGQSRQIAEAVRRTCVALPARGCTVMEASMRSGAMPGATIRMRVTPAGVNKVLGSLDGRGEVVAQSTSAKDLAEPIQDGERKMAMLTGYRDQLQTLARQRALEPEALIKLHRELAQVQSEIENTAGSSAQLRTRVDTELLTVVLQEQAAAGHKGAVRQAIDDFTDDLLQGVAMLITFVASTIPFALAGTAGYLVWRRLRARRRKAAAQ